MPLRPRYRRRELLPYPGAMRPLFYRKRKLRRLFTCPLEQSIATELIDAGANPLSVRKGVPLFWYRAFAIGGLQWLESANLSNRQLARRAVLPDGSKRTLFEQVTMEPLSIRHMLGRGIGKRFATPMGGIAPKPPSRDRKPTYDELAVYLLGRGVQTPSEELIASLLARDRPLVHAFLHAMLLERASQSPQGAVSDRRRL